MLKQATYERLMFRRAIEDLFIQYIYLIYLFISNNKKLILKLESSN
jgi:hypothetical protein